MPTLETLEHAQELVSYRFNDTRLLATALTHASIAETRLESNERLEFLGDAILGAVVCADLYSRFPIYDEGDLTKLKSVVVSRKICAEIADDIGLTPLLLLGKGMNGKDVVPMSLRAAVLETLIGAVYLDGGFGAAKEFILKHIGPHIEQADASAHQQNHKSQLQQYAQKHFATAPQYQQLDEQGPDHCKCFEVCVTMGHRRFPPAWGASKKEAEQHAAQLAIQELTQADAECEADHAPTE